MPPDVTRQRQKEQRRKRHARPCMARGGGATKGGRGASQRRGGAGWAFRGMVRLRSRISQNAATPTPTRQRQQQPPETNNAENRPLQRPASARRTGAGVPYRRCCSIQQNEDG